MRDSLGMTITDVESVSVRAVAGDGDQLRLEIATRRGWLELALIARPGRVIRVTDRRAKDRKRKPQGVAFADVFGGAA